MSQKQSDKMILNPDIVATKAEKQDVVILVMGATGVGKSSFINTLLPQEKMEVGVGLAPCTTELVLGYMHLEKYPDLMDYRVVLVDTPGFDDTYNDFKILEKIAKWLEDSYTKGSKLGGVIYLHDISATRFTGTAARNLEVFENLCGKQALQNVILAVTKWNLDPKESPHRHEELKGTYWKRLIDNNAAVLRIDDNYDSAWCSIKKILSMKAHPVLQIQDEMVDKGMTLRETLAGSELYNVAVLNSSSNSNFRRPKLHGNDDSSQVFQGKKKDETQLGSQLQELRMPLSRRFLRFFRLA